jgi:hypothetical protein
MSSVAPSAIRRDWKLFNCSGAVHILKIPMTVNFPSGAKARAVFSALWHG